MSDFSISKDTSRRANSVSITTVALPVIFLVGILLAQHTLYVETYTTGEKLYRKKNYSDAYGYFSQVFTQSSDKDLRAKSLYMRALCSYKEEKYSRAAQEFEEFVRMFPDHPLVYRAAFWAGDANFNIGNYLASAQDFAVAMLENDARWQMRASKSLENILWGYLPIDYFPTLLDRVDRSLEGFIAVYWLRRLQYDGEYAQALREGQKMLQRVYDAQSKRKLEDEINNIVDYLKNNLVVAVLIPQQGDYAEYGIDVERGVRLAFSGVGKNIDLRILDTGGDPLKTAKQMDKLMQSTTPLCIIGPITSNETVAAGALAGTYKVPLITPSASRDGIAEISPYIFQMIASPVKASAYLARFSSDSMDTFAILAPDDELGHSCAMAFASVIAGEGKTLLGAEFYTRGTVDFSQHLANIKEPILQ
ncbi:ABC transporter substrate-binding protein, partial [bacterium]|nr:ABC transporter substrate-binding protein [bacterium]